MACCLPMVTLRRGYSFANGDGAGTISTPADWERGYQRTTFDSTHSFVSSFVYMLPWGPDGKWMREGVIGKVLGDWQVTGVVSAISGTPIDFTANAAGLRAPGNTNTPNVSGTPDVLGGIGSGNLWFDTSVFSAPGNNEWGNVDRRGLLNGPAYYNMDFSVVKVLRVGSKRAEIRADFFNGLTSALRKSQWHARATRTSAGSPAYWRRPSAQFALEDAFCSNAALEDWKIGRLIDWKTASSWPASSCLRTRRPRSSQLRRASIFNGTFGRFFQITASSVTVPTPRRARRTSG